MLKMLWLGSEDWLEKIKIGLIPQIGKSTGRGRIGNEI